MASKISESMMYTTQSISFLFESHFSRIIMLLLPLSFFFEKPLYMRVFRLRQLFRCVAEKKNMCTAYQPVVKTKNLALNQSLLFICTPIDYTHEQISDWNQLERAWKPRVLWEHICQELGNEPLLHMSALCRLASISPSGRPLDSGSP